MPTVICSYCEYVGKGTSPATRFRDVETHEKICEQRISEENDSRGNSK